jgi:hypothetical protein
MDFLGTDMLSLPIHSWILNIEIILMDAKFATNQKTFILISLLLDWNEKTI